MSLIRYIKSDVKLVTEEFWDHVNMEKKIDGFRLYSKDPLSNAYQVCGVIGLDYTYKLLELINDAIKNKRRAIRIDLSHGIGYERLFIWKGSFRKLEEQIFEMIAELQKQY